MRLLPKTILVISVTLFLMLVGFYFYVQQILLKTYTELEEKEVQRDLQMVVDTVIHETKMVSAKVRDWAAWDETYRFIKDHNKQFIKSNFSPDTLDGLKIDIMIFIDRQGKVVAVLKKPNSLNEPELIAQILAHPRELLNHPDEKSEVYGTITLRDTIMILGSQPIVRSDGKGPIRGTLLFGRFFDESLTNELAERLHLRVNFRRLDNAASVPHFRLALANLMSKQQPFLALPQDNSTLWGFTLLHDIFQQPNIFVYLIRERAIYQQGLQSLHSFLMALTVFGLIFLSITLVLIRQTVLARLSRIVRDIQRITLKNSTTERVKIRGTDELAVLSRVINDMLTVLDSNSQEIRTLNERLKAENIRMGAELDVTRRLQQMILPKEQELAQITELEIASFMEPASEVGGDYYDVLRYNGGVKIGIGDVTGHGLESGILMLMVQTAIRTLLNNQVTDPHIFFEVLNHTLYDNLQRMNIEKNLSLTLLDYAHRRIRLSGQHEEVLIVRSGGSIERIDTFSLGFTMGLVDNIHEFIAEMTIELNTGDMVVLYTDGITEAENEHGQLYGLERLCEILSLNWQHSAHEVKCAIMRDVKQYIGTQRIFDDITLVVLKQK